MKKSLTLIIALIQTLSAFTQINFEEGYIIDKSGNRIECFLKNNDLFKSLLLGD